jgi:molecular chaperone HtpG
MTIHYRAEGRQEYQVLAFVPGSRPFDLFDQDRHGRVKLYVRRVFITDEAELLPRYLRFVRGIVDLADLPLNVARDDSESPLLASIKKGVTGRILGDLGSSLRIIRGLREDMGKLRNRAQGRHLRGFRRRDQL